MTGLLTYEQFRAIRDAANRAFCEQEIATWTPIEATLAKEVRKLVAVYVNATSHEKRTLADGLQIAGKRWREASTRLHAARGMLESLTGSHKLHIAIIGSRDYPDLQAVVGYVNGLPDNTVIVSGGARGVDATAAHAARVRGLEVIEYLADWDTYGKSAGFRRNADIVNAADKVVAFWDGTSKGTAHSIRLARQAGKPVEVIEWRQTA